MNTARKPEMRPTLDTFTTSPFNLTRFRSKFHPNILSFHHRLPSSVHRELCRLVVCKSLPPNMTIFAIGERAFAFYIILQGLVKLKSRDIIAGGLKTKATLGPGQCFGELGGVTSEAVRDCCAVTSTVVELLEVRREVLLWLK